MYVFWILVFFFKKEISLNEFMLLNKYRLYSSWNSEEILWLMRNQQASNNDI